MIDSRKVFLELVILLHSFKNHGFTIVDYYIKVLFLMNNSKILLIVVLQARQVLSIYCLISI